MKRVGRSAAVLLVALLALAIGAYPVGAGGKNKVKSDTLTGYQEAPAVSSTGTGSFAAEIDEATGTITYELTYRDLSTPAQAAHIHFGNRFTAGGVSAFLCGGSKPACLDGTVVPAIVTGIIVPADVIGPATQGITPGDFGELVRAIRAGMTYANVHTTLFPGGEIRGQINDDNQRQP